MTLLASCTQSSRSCSLDSNICSCDYANASVEAGSCTDFSGGLPETKEENCTEDGGSFSAVSLCTSENRGGTCKGSILGNENYIRYYGDVTDEATAAAACNVNGVSFYWLTVLSGTAAFEWTSD